MTFLFNPVSRARSFLLKQIFQFLSPADNLEGCPGQSETLSIMGVFFPLSLSRTAAHEFSENISIYPKLSCGFLMSDSELINSPSCHLISPVLEMHLVGSLVGEPN